MSNPLGDHALPPNDLSTSKQPEMGFDVEEADAASNDTYLRLSTCLCGCGKRPKGRSSEFLPGHDGKLAHQIKREVAQVGGVANLKKIVRSHLAQAQ